MPYGSMPCSLKLPPCLTRYGVKMEALALVQDWIQNVGSAAGLTQENTYLSSGAVGAPESRLEVASQTVGRLGGVVESEIRIRI